MTETNTVRGSCLCGAVTYEASGPALVAGICHCKDCQKFAGAPHSAFAAYPADNVKVLGRTAAFSNKADSGSTVTRHFCPTCGSSLFGENSGMPGMRAINVGTADGDVDFKAAFAAYDFRRRAWDPKAEGVAYFERMPPMPGR